MGLLSIIETHSHCLGYNISNAGLSKAEASLSITLTLNAYLHNAKMDSFVLGDPLIKINKIVKHILIVVV